ncbi:hypothetical protein AVEN_333-1 [Araneus ventricosus]|uniref:Uncharacterized protein n=1 Tax=Araneus ventricosus TaxID=182803 RepID=A0A4Y2HYS0_ARAVE|nr:hypothetical protein AVEN_333-1 [Araneus ventricosus]
MFLLLPDREVVCLCEYSAKMFVDGGNQCGVDFFWVGWSISVMLIVVIYICDGSEAILYSPPIEKIVKLLFQLEENRSSALGTEEIEQFCYDL